MTARTRLYRIAAGAAATALLLGTTACSDEQVPAGGEGSAKFAVITEWDGGSFWAVVKQGSQQAARDLGVELVFNTADGDHERQAQLIASAVTDRVDGIAVSAADPDAITDAVQQARAAGIPVVTLNSGAEQSAALGAIAHIGQTETVAGTQAGKRLADAGGTRLLCINGEGANVGQVQRCQGAQRGFTGRTEVVNVKGAGDIATTLSEIESKLRADPQVDAVLTLNPDIALAARDAIKSVGREVKLGTFDLSRDVLSAIEQGEVDFAVDQQPYLQGYLPIMCLNLFRTNANLVGGGSPVLTGPAFVDQSNAKDVQKLVEQGTR
ncbi:substrate-binding domain-containing protein [Micromonospora sp. WMMD712]|uniref:substrate-binding domain-containing protein n=1 Tax=Micromonospora sp. WMMD712 TaxID=3016096 RepID=UPI00249A4C36|nr:substrate-binding domain-containing protein [Micromonospora sp. WMMD712]WFE60204.1 substrate-binding domain-containing protein [Micromonospora sp. WMMD712]